MHQLGVFRPSPCTKDTAAVSTLCCYCRPFSNIIKLIWGILSRGSTKKIPTLDRLRVPFFSKIFSHHFGPDGDQLLHWFCKQGDLKMIQLAFRTDHALCSDVFHSENGRAVESSVLDSDSRLGPIWPRRCSNPILDRSSLPISI